MEAIVEQKGPSIASLQAQANAAENRLGAGRKLYVTLAGLDPSKPMVDWKEVSTRANALDDVGSVPSSQFCRHCSVRSS